MEKLEVLKDYVRCVIKKQNKNPFWKGFTQHYTPDELLELVDDIQLTENGIYFDSAKLKGEIDITWLIYQVIGYSLCLMKMETDKCTQEKKNAV